MDCLSESGNAISDAGDFSPGGVDAVLLNQPNGAGRRAHEGQASDDLPALSRCDPYRDLLPRSFVDRILGVTKKASSVRSQIET